MTKADEELRRKVAKAFLQYTEQRTLHKDMEISEAVWVTVKLIKEAVKEERIACADTADGYAAMNFPLPAMDFRTSRFLSGLVNAIQYRTRLQETFDDAG